MNQVTLCGYLAKDFTISETKNKVLVAKNFLGITSKSVAKNQDNNNEAITTIKEHTDWIPIVIFGKNAQIAEKYLKKGDKFLGSGRIFTSTYEDENGETRYSWQVIIRRVEFVHKETSKDLANSKNPPKQEAHINEEDMKIIAENEQKQQEEVSVF